MPSVFPRKRDPFHTMTLLRARPSTKHKPSRKRYHRRRCTVMRCTQTTLFLSLLFYLPTHSVSLLTLPPRPLRANRKRSVAPTSPLGEKNSYKQTHTLHMSTSLLPEAEMGSPGYVVGALFGCASALLCTALINRFMPAPSTVAKQPTSLPMLSRRERAEKKLTEMRAQRAGGATSTQGGDATTAASAAAAIAAPESSGSSSWASTGEGSDGSDAEDKEEVDSEYERMEDMRLKMVFVFRHPVQPKISPQELAVLTASAGVQLVELHQQMEDGATPRLSHSQTVRSVANTASLTPEVSFTPDKENRQRWWNWYLWWNRIGCAKITLRCPDKVAMDAVVASAREMRLPVVQLHRSQFRTLDGVMVQGGVAPVGGDEVVLMALGPAPSGVLEPVTGALKLFS